MFSLKMRKNESRRLLQAAADRTGQACLNRGGLMSNAVRIFSVFLVFVFIVSCSTTHELPYIADATRDSATPVANTYSSTIHPGDQLYIYVSSQTPESVIPFNQETNRNALQGNSSLTAQGSQPTANIGYLVDEQGNIIFPVLGKIMSAGMTLDSLAKDLQHRLIVQGYVSDPIVTVQLMNFRVAVIGEVKVPREIHVDGTRLTIFEALAMCGDLTLYGKRDDIKVLREDHGEYTLGQIDLTSRTLLDSPYYYLRQNDIVYVEPNDKRKRQSYDDAATAQELAAYISLGGSAVRTAYMVFTNYITLHRQN